MNEIFKDVIGFEHLYEVSNFGNIRSKITGIVRKYQIDKHGYASLKLSRKPQKPLRMFVHRIVALAWISNPDNKSEINHKDRNVLNNSISNLEWVTQKENYTHFLTHR